MKKELFIWLLMCVLLPVRGEIVTYDYNVNIRGTYDSETETLTISGTGAIPKNKTPDYKINNVSQSSHIKKIIVGEGITEIKENVLSAYYNLKNIQFPSTLTKIGKNNFENSTKISQIQVHSPNQWAQVEIVDYTAHPFGNTPVHDSISANRAFYFYGSTTKARELVFTPGLTKINQITFCNARYFTSLSIPRSVTTIGYSALNCEFDEVAVNCTTAPSLEYTNTVTFSSEGKLYVPTGAKANYTIANYWLLDTYKSTFGVQASNVFEQELSGIISTDINWELANDGTLTLFAAGTNKEINIVNLDQCPWGHFRNLVGKVFVRGEIVNLSNALTWCHSIIEYYIDQTAIPAAEAINHEACLNTRDNARMKIHVASLTHLTINRLGGASWNSYLLKRELLEEVTVADNDINSAILLSSISSYIDEPFDLQLSRNLSNEYYNTFCSPIALNSIDICASGTDIRELTSTSFNEATNTFTLIFSDPLTNIEAGHPYIIKPDNTVSLMSFSDVVPSEVVGLADNAFAVEGGHITAHGILAPYTPEHDEYGENFLFLKENNTLAWAQSGTLNAMRAFFKIAPSAPQHLPQARMVMHFGQIATNLIKQNKSKVEGGKFLRNGQIFIMNGGKIYNAQGQIVE